MKKDLKIIICELKIVQEQENLETLGKNSTPKLWTLGHQTWEYMKNKSLIAYYEPRM